MTAYFGAIVPMASIGKGVYSYFTYLSPGDSGAFYFLNDSTLDAREAVPSECALWNGTDRKYKVGDTDCEFAYTWETCEPPGSTSYNDGVMLDKTSSLTVTVYPNPARNILYVDFYSQGREVTFEMLDGSGRLLESRRNNGSKGTVAFNLENYSPNLYVLKSTDGTSFNFKKVILVKDL